MDDWLRKTGIKNILLIICPPFWHKLPPLGLAYVSEYLKSLDYNADVIDLNVEKMQMDNIANYDCIGFSVFKSNQNNTLALVKEIKTKNDKPKIILGGPQCFSWGFEKAPSDIKYADRVFAGDVVTDLNEGPFPTFNGFKLNEYERKRALPILSSRGCIRKCVFCGERLLSDRYSARDPEKTIEEIRYQKKTKNTKWFTFHDSLVNGDLKRLEELCDLAAEEDIVWDAQAIIRKDMPETLLGKIKESGCFNLFIGLESGSDKVLKLMRKGFTADDAEGFFRKCNSAGLHFEISLILGLPGEGKEEFNETVSFIKRNKKNIPKIAQINPFIRCPGTEIEQTPVRNGLERVEYLIKLIEDLGIKYTPEFINNLNT